MLGCARRVHGDRAYSMAGKNKNLKQKGKRIMFFAKRRKKEEALKKEEKMRKLKNFAYRNDMESLTALLSRSKDDLTMQQLEAIDEEMRKVEAEGQDFYDGRIGRTLLQMKETKMCNIILGKSNDDIDINEGLEERRRACLAEDKRIVRDLSKIVNQLDRLVERDGDHDAEGNALLADKRRLEAMLNTNRHTLAKVEQLIENHVKAVALHKERETLQSVGELARVRIDDVLEDADSIKEYSEQLDEEGAIIDKAMPVNEPVSDFQKYKEMKIIQASGIGVIAEESGTSRAESTENPTNE